MSKFHKNGIVTGDLDSLCLLCEVHLKTEEDATIHLSESVHKKNMDTSKYLEKFKGHNIRKVKTGYYCEFCNLLLSTVSKMKIHVADPTHVENENRLTLRWCGASVIASNNVAIAAPAWNGFLEDMCAVCNSEIIDENAHKKDLTHILNLIKKPVKFGAEGFMFRMVDDISYHCLTCNQIFTLNSLSSHHDDEQHKISYENSFYYNLPSFDNVADQKPKADNEDLNNISNTETDKDKIFDHLAEFQKKGININFVSETAFCIKCSSNVDMSFEDIGRHIESHQVKNLVDTTKSDVNESNIVLSGKKDIAINHNETDTDLKDIANQIAPSIVTKGKKVTANEPQVNAQDKSKKLEDPKTFAEANNLTYYKGNAMVYCGICTTAIPSSLKSMMEHVAGASHSERINTKNVTASKQVYVPKKPMEKFMESGVKVKTFFYEDVVVNEKYCLSRLSFEMVTSLASHLRCHACGVNLIRMQLRDHFDSPKHETVLEGTLVVTNLVGEFVREVRRGLYHCGYCNLIAGDWTELKQHLMCELHKDARSRAECRLRDHLPDIYEMRWRQQMTIANLFGDALLRKAFNF